MRRLLFTFVLATALSASAQYRNSNSQPVIHGTPPSVTSLGQPTGTLANVPPSVTSLSARPYNGRPNTRGGSGFSRVGPANSHGLVIIGERPIRPHHRPGRNGTAPFYFPYAYSYGYGYGGYPYYYGDTEPQNPPQQPEMVMNDDTAEPPAPTVFEHRPTQAFMVTPATTAQPQAPPPMPPPADTTPQVPTTLIFRDGRQMNITNYAIKGDTLFNLSGNGPFRIPLAQLDVPATQRLNDDHGISFNVPTQ